MKIKSGKIFGLNRNVFFLGLVSFFNDFSAEMVISVFPAFLTVALGAPPVFLGVMEGAADALASFWKIVSGWFSDKIQRRKIIAVSGYSLSVMARSLLVFVGSIWQVFVIRMVDRIGKGTREAPRDALLAESVADSEVGRSFGYQRAMDTLGGVFGTLAAIAIFYVSPNYKLLFFISFLIGTLAVASFIFVREIKGSSAGGERHHHSHKLSFSLSTFPSYFKLFILAVFVFGLGTIPLSLMLLKVNDAVPGSALYIPIMYLVYNTSSAAFAVPFGRFSDQIGKRKVIAGGFFVAIVAYLIFANFSSLASVYAGFILFGLYSAMTDGIERAKASRLVPHDVLAQGEGFLGAAVGVSSLLAGLVAGSIWTLFGSSAAFTYGAVMMTIGFILFLYWNGFWQRHQNLAQ